MKFSEFGEKEIINLSNGEKLGYLYDADLVVDEQTGKIQAILVTEGKGQFSLFNSDRNYYEIPWDSIKKIGSDMLIIEVEEKKLSRYR